MHSRRTFLQKLIAGSAGGAFAQSGLGNLFAQSPPDEGGISKKNDGSPDWEAIRKEFSFPEKMAYFNTATIGLMPRTVMDATESGLKALMKGQYNSPVKIDEVIGRAFGANPQEITFTHNTTHGINIVAQGLKLKSGDEIILTDQEHVGNAVPWLVRAKRDHLKIKVLQPGPDQESTLDRLKALITRKTKVIAVPHITCTNGQVLPIREIVVRFSDAVPFIFFDGAHGPGTTSLDLHGSGCGFYATCGHKWLCGPAGTGFLYIREDLLNEVSPIFVGAGSDKSWELSAYKQEVTGWHEGASRFEYGTQNRAMQDGFAAALQFQIGIGMPEIHARARNLADRLRKELKVWDWLEILTPEEEASRASMLSFRPKDISRRLPFIKYLQAGSPFRIREVQESGLEAVRVSTHFFNTEEEVVQLADRIGDWKP